MPSMLIENIFHKSKRCVFYDNVTLADEKNSLEGVIKYNPNFN